MLELDDTGFGRRSDESYRLLRVWAYSLIRQMDLACALLWNVSETKHKFALGRKIGFDAISLKMLLDRLSEIGCISDQCCGTAELAAAFDQAARIKDTKEAIHFLSAATAETQRSMIAHIEQNNSDCFRALDEPTIFVLRSVIEFHGNSLAQLIGRDLPSPEMGFDKIGPCDTSYTASSLLPAMRTQPGREFPLTQYPASILDQPIADLVASLVGRQKILFFLFVDIELPAAEVCARMIVEHRDMPIEFRFDMARQVWDEVRHAELAILRCRQLGEVPDFRYTGLVIERWLAGNTIDERLAIQQIIQEGNSLDATLNLGQLLDLVGDVDTAQMLRVFCRDEMLHSRFGNKWVLCRLAGDQDAYRKLIDRMGKKIGATIPATSKPNITLRALAGFPQGFLAELSKGVTVGKIEAGTAAEDMA